MPTISLTKDQLDLLLEIVRNEHDLADDSAWDALIEDPENANDWREYANSLGGLRQAIAKGLRPG